VTVAVPILRARSSIRARRPRHRRSVLAPCFAIRCARVLQADSISIYASEVHPDHQTERHFRLQLANPPDGKSKTAMNHLSAGHKMGLMQAH